MTDDDDDFQLQDPIRVDQTDDGATYSNDKKLKAIGILGAKTNVVNDFKFLKRTNNVEVEKKKRKKNDNENVNKLIKNTFKKESTQSATILMVPIEKIHLNNIKEEKFKFKNLKFK